MEKRIFTGNQLKIIALVVMTIDHIGKMIYPDVLLFSIIGRLAYPLFGYFIAEGCRYTKNRLRYFLTVFGTGLLCQIVCFVVENSLYMEILITFSLSMALIFMIDNAIKNRGVAIIIAMFLVVAVLFVCEGLPLILNKTDFSIDYGFFGVLFPVFVYLASGKIVKICTATVGLVAVSLSIGGIQWFSLLAVPLLLLYNGKRGKYKLKYLFYVYYPLHLAVIYFMAVL